MAGGPRSDVTLLLERVRAGDERARGELIALVYGELRRAAANLMRRERSDHTLPPTALAWIPMPFFWPNKYGRLPNI